MNSQTVSLVEGNTFDLTRLCRYFSERSPHAMVAVEGPTHAVRYSNAAFARLAGMASAEFLGRPFAEIAPGRKSNESLAVLERVYQTGLPEKLADEEVGQSPPTYWSYEMWAIVGPDERPVGVMIHVTDATEEATFRRQMRAMNEALVVSSVRQHELIDTIERSERDRLAMQTQMFQAQKLESLGVLAGGIAHDLNNMLTPVLAYAELASNALPEGSVALPMLEEVRKNARHAANLVQQILAYAGKGRFVVQPIDLSKLIREMTGILGSAISVRANLQYDLSPTLPLIEGDSTQLYQVVLNLVTNASEAMPENGGAITVRTGVVAPDRQLQQSSAFDKGRPQEPSVFLEVADSGCGMHADAIGKIFDPFFTTKFTGRGLGLAVVQGIARGHGGIVEVHSEPGSGSTFRLILPSSSKPLLPKVVSRAATGWVGSATILVIDDDAMILGLLTQMLQMVGLSVLVAQGGPEGLKKFREHRREIDAVVLDLTMPEMGGFEVAKALRELNADIPIILMSGFSVAEVTFQSAGLGITGFVQKPFNNADLLATIRHALGR